ncbi:Uncharacterised protein [Mycobacteroides abscessus subsp. abscessus]|nr:Uncharacterised protein [Mycobacteroides abscessus subsp. abscessus]
MRYPLGVHVTGRIAAQGKDIGDTAIDIRTHHGAQLIDGVSDGRQVRDRQQRGVLGKLTGHPDRAVTGGTARTVGDRNEHRPVPLENSCRPP